ncbi:hypothetical protein BCR33DRAFT_577628 [Rhizoclosmatium globosum]|uniref:DUF833-domain-containing protein n=1 Tax=Rhizoclosmatium globosum TaxID=329046 RepID=A0A1Y2B4K6_9FUNG|nr:hypothetical protein BCR33DRAFT_577628 [Rhizoclosmatium globosum]|eukprot:ORY29480.1 hypothetical protein BCR33DRAFT_577628 [Rhizoclosmatium globosum]
MCIVLFRFSSLAHHPRLYVLLRLTNHYPLQPTDFHVLSPTESRHPTETSSLPVPRKPPPSNQLRLLNQQSKCLFSVAQTLFTQLRIRVRSAQPQSQTALSRGALVSDFVISTQDPLTYLSSIDPKQFNGFNLVVGSIDSNSAWNVYYLGSHSQQGIRKLDEDTTYAMTNMNDLIVGPDAWFKVQHGVSRFDTILQDTVQDNANHSQDPLSLRDNLVESLLDVLRDTSRPTDPPAVPLTPIEKLCTPICIPQYNGYGTRTHTVLVIPSSSSSSTSPSNSASSKFVEIDRYVLSPTIEWDGRNARIFGTEQVIESGIEFCEQRRDFEFEIELRE